MRTFRLKIEGKKYKKLGIGECKKFLNVHLLLVIVVVFVGPPIE
jgi:hypothetical protein